MSSRPICRYFISGQCRYGNECTFLHERSNDTPNVCRFNERGTCQYGTACRYDHVKTKKSNKTGVRAPPPIASIVTNSCLNANAPSFVPSWLKKPEGSSYAEAAGAAPFIPLPTLCPYNELGNCAKGNDCEYIHGLLCDLCKCKVLHPLSVEQQSLHIAQCTAKHELQMKMAFAEQRSKEKSCGICMENVFEKNLRFGILENCKHCFCVECIREWRGKGNEFDTKTVRSCPECRQHSDFVVPCIIWIEEKEEKELLFTMYRENAKKKKCKYYVPYSVGDCPFGNKCFYLHENPDGTRPIDYRPGENRRREPELLSAYFEALELEVNGDGEIDYINFLISNII
uniref:RING-type E3 ubiquitin transferase n=1 Tax=Pristionchus pacificus TaxID=54126 RepID=A0A8R1V846_PRIPA